MADKSEITETDIADSAVESFFARNRAYLTAAAITLIFVMMTFAIYRLTSEVRYDDVIAALLDTSFSSVLLAIVFTALSFLSLIFMTPMPSNMSARKCGFRQWRSRPSRPMPSATPPASGR